MTRPIVVASFLLMLTAHATFADDAIEIKGSKWSWSKTIKGPVATIALASTVTFADDGKTFTELRFVDSGVARPSSWIFKGTYSIKDDQLIAIGKDKESGTTTRLTFQGHGKDLLLIERDGGDKKDVYSKINSRIR